VTKLDEEAQNERLDTARNGFNLGGAVIGFALAQTWPNSLQEMSEWPTRAADKADVEGFLKEHVDNADNCWRMQALKDLLSK
jgi:hypothetical protein